MDETIWWIILNDYNQIGDSGGSAIGEALKVNSTLTQFWMNVILFDSTQWNIEMTKLLNKTI